MSKERTLIDKVNDALCCMEEFEIILEGILIKYKDAWEKLANK